MAGYYEGEPLRIGLGTQLLLDDQIVEDRWGLERRLEKPEKYLRNPVLMKDRPWEGDISYRPMVMWDEEYGRYRIWYQCYSNSGYHGSGIAPPYHVCYAESDDGFNWEKPLLDVCEWPGYEKTNIVYYGTHRKRVQGVQVFKDMDESDPQKRYKMICIEARPKNGELQSGVSCCHSPDGLHWTLSEGEHFIDYHSDCFNHVVYDEVEKSWLLYCRPIFMFASGRWELRGGQPGERHMRRRIAMSSSRDFRTWSYPRTVMYPDERDLPDYDNCVVFRYASHYMMMYAAMDGDDTGTFDIKLASSPDGIRWERFHGREIFIPRGIAGEFDAGRASTSCPPVRQGEDLLIYYSGTTKGQHQRGVNGGIGVALIKADRFVEQHAGNEPGYLMTKEFILDGNRLELNVAADGGAYREREVRVEIARHPAMGQHPANVDKKSYSQGYPGFSYEDCDPISSDRTDCAVTWKGNPDLSSLKGKPVYLRFELRNMGIYSFRIKEA